MHFEYINKQLQGFATPRGLRYLMSGLHSAYSGQVEPQRDGSGIVPSTLPTVRDFEKRLRQSGKYSNSQAKQYAAAYNRMTQHIETQHREGEFDAEDMQAAKQLIENIKKGIR